MSGQTYTARYPCGCILSMHVVDSSSVLKWIKKETSEGALIEMVSSEEIRSGAVVFGHVCGIGEQDQKELFDEQEA